jgi:hypothetical protein
MLDTDPKKSSATTKPGSDARIRVHNPRHRLLRWVRPFSMIAPILLCLNPPLAPFWRSFR